MIIGCKLHCNHALRYHNPVNKIPCKRQFCNQIEAHRGFTFMLLNIEDKVAMGSMCCCNQVLVDSLKIYIYGLCESVDYFWLTYATYFYVYWKFGFVRRDQALSLLTTTVCIHSSHSLMQAGVHKKKKPRNLQTDILFAVVAVYMIFSSIRSLATDHWCMDKAQ